MKWQIFVLAFTCATLTALPALADGKIYVPLPDMAPMAVDRAEAEAFLHEAYTVGVLGANCSNVVMSEEASSLVEDSADLLAYGELHLDTSTLDDRYSKPAFDYLDQPDACDNAQERLDTLLDKLIAMGGSLEPLPDQEKAYVEWRAMMDKIGN